MSLIRVRCQAPYEPFLDLISAMFEEQGGQNFDEFLEENDIYYLHRQMLRSYRKGGFCRREEGLILGEIEYEQECMTEGILRMLLSLSENKPCLIILNRIQLAAGTTLTLLDRLLEEEKAKNIGVVLGVNDLIHIPEHVLPVWDSSDGALKRRESGLPYRDDRRGAQKTVFGGYFQKRRILKEDHQPGAADGFFPGTLLS